MPVASAGVPSWISNVGFKYYSHRTDRGESYALDKVEKMRLISRAVSMRREVLVEVQWAEK